jgi:hypothetical protein
MPEDLNEKTTIQLTKTTVEKLKDKGRKGESYDDIIQRMLYENHTRGG